jgi:transcriptional regulator with XRE-family HTH domain
LPFDFKCKKSVHREKYPDAFRTWGDWIKVRRLDLKLTKRQLSLKFHVDDTTIYLWEKNRVRPSLAKIPKIIEFLGCDPFRKEAENLEDRIREYRRIHGLSQKKLATWMEIDQTTLAGWERGERRLTKKSLERLFVFLASFMS